MVQILTTSERNGSLVQQREKGTIYHLPICIPSTVTRNLEKFENEIVDVQWHPFKSIISFSTKDSVYVYSTLSQVWYPTSAQGLVHDLQQNITCLAWKPYSAMTIAVGSKLGVCLWRVFQSSTEPSIHGIIPIDKDASSWMIPLFVPGLEDVNCIDWSPDGSLLVVGYKNVPTIVVWDVARHEPTILSRGPKASSTNFKFSPDGSFLLQSLGTNYFSIWETGTWDMQTLSIASPITSFQWIPNTNMFLFTMKQSPKVHLLQMKGTLEVTNAPSIDLPTLSVPAVQSHSSKAIERIELDPTGTRLAVTFENVSEVGLYELKMKPLPDLKPMY
jgi:WD40 repeat protein